jgi:hypothetical protein
MGYESGAFIPWPKATSRHASGIGTSVTVNSHGSGSTTVPARAGDNADAQLENARLRTLIIDLLLEKMQLRDDAHQSLSGNSVQKKSG